MGRGRKPNKIQTLDYNTVFYNSVGSYVGKINDLLSQTIISEPLSNHIKIIGGYAFKSANYLAVGVPVIRISDFSDEKIILKNVKFYKESDSLKQYELEAGDIIIALTGGTIAKLGIVQNGMGKLYLNQRVGKFEIINTSEFEKEYVYWIARSVQTIIKDLAWGAAIPNVSPKQIEKLKFPIPDKATQRGIVLFLNDLRNNCVKNVCYFHEEIESEILFMQNRSLHSAGIKTELTHQQTLLKKLRQQILQEAIEGKLTKDWREDNPDIEPASELLKRIQAEKAQLIKDKKIKKQKPLPPISDEEKPFALPDGWVWCYVGEFCTKVTDGFHNTPKKLNAGKIYISATHIRESGINWDKCLYVSQQDHEELYKKAYPQKGEILITNRGAGCATPVIIDINEEFSFQNAALIGFNQALISNKYVFYNILKMRDEIMEVFVNGGLQPMLSNVRLGSIPIPLPPLPEQKAIVAKVEKLLALCDQLETQITRNQSHANALMQAVLKEAFTSEATEPTAANA